MEGTPTAFRTLKYLRTERSIRLGTSGRRESTPHDRPAYSPRHNLERRGCRNWLWPPSGPEQIWATPGAHPHGGKEPSGRATRHRGPNAIRLRRRPTCNRCSAWYRGAATLWKQLLRENCAWCYEACSACGRDFFVPGTLEYGAASAPKQCGERIQLVENGSEFASDFPLFGIERSGCAGFFRENHGGMPRIGDARIQFQMGAKRGGRLYHAHEHVFRAVAQQCAIAQR